MATTTKKYVSLDKLSLYDDKIKAKIAADDAATLKSAKDYADSLAENYDAAGSAATAETNAKAYADGKDAAIQAAQKAADDAAAAAATADEKAVTAQGEVDALESYVGTFTHDTAKTVVEYINAKTDGIATSGNLEALGARVTAVEGDVATIKGDYLKGSDKEELIGDIADVQAAVEAEQARAEGKEAELAASIKAISDDYLKGADKEELQGNIDTLTGVVETLRDGVDAEKVDGVIDLINYVEEHGTEVTGMQEDIAENASAIAGVAGRMTTAEGEIDTLQGAMATKVEQSVYDAKIAELAGADTTLSGRIDVLEGKFGEGEGSVEDMVADAKAEAIEAAGTVADTKDEAVLAAAKKYADEEDAKIEERVGVLETASATHALASDVTALAGRVETAEGEIDTLQSEMDAVEALAAAADAAAKANASALATKAETSALTAVSDRVTTLETWHNNFTEASEAEINELFA